MIHTILLIIASGLMSLNQVQADSEQSIPEKMYSEVTYEEKLEIAIEHFYQTRWEEASELFKDLKKQSPDDPRPYFFESMMPFWEYFLVHQKDDLAEKFLKKSESAVKLSKQKLDRQPDDTTMVLLLSGLHGYRSLVAAGENNYRVAIQSGITGFNYTRQLLSVDSDRPDARIGRGMFYYMMGSVPSEVRWLTHAAGLKGDVEKGFEELKEAASSDNIIRYDAKIMLMYLHEKEENYSEALKYADKLTERFNENVIFHFKNGELNEVNNNRESAISCYEKVILLDNPRLKEVTEISIKRVNSLKAIGYSVY